jgi:hypothetical protein
MVFALPLASVAASVVGLLLDLAPTEIIVSIMAANGAFLVAIFLVEG